MIFFVLFSIRDFLTFSFLCSRENFVKTLCKGIFRKWLRSIWNMGSWSALPLIVAVPFLPVNFLLFPSGFSKFHFKALLFGFWFLGFFIIFYYFIFKFLTMSPCGFLKVGRSYYLFVWRVRAKGFFGSNLLLECFLSQKFEDRINPKPSQNLQTN